MSSRIFISYRREDTQQAVGRLSDDLVKHFDREQVFDDITSIVPGADFVEALQQGLESCAAMLVVIGQRWLTAADGKGRRRLDVPDDWVRQEVAESLKRTGVRVFPVLVDGAEMPSKEELPEDLQPLVRRQAFPLTVRHWRNDVELLIEFLKKVPGLAPTPGPKSPQVKPAVKSAGPSPKNVTTDHPATASRPEARAAPPVESAQASAPPARAEKEKQLEGAQLRPKTSIGQRGDGAALLPSVPWKPLAAVGAVLSIAILMFLGRSERPAPAPPTPVPGVVIPPAQTETASTPAPIIQAPEAQPAPRGFKEAPPEAATTFRPGASFGDCTQCPTMIVIPAGEFVMGSPEGEAGREKSEGPQHNVTIAHPFAVGKYEVTFDEWDACVAAGGCAHKPDDRGWGRGRQPVINVSWEDAQAYTSWLSKKTGKPYRLLSEAEWEYAARAGTTTRYPWGYALGTNRANFVGSGIKWSGKQAAPVGSFDANPLGLHDMIGNVREWVQDCWNDGFYGAPGDGRAWERGDCGRRVVRGGSWYDDPELARAASRGRFGSGNRYVLLGFRVARTR